MQTAPAPQRLTKISFMIFTTIVVCGVCQQSALSADRLFSAATTQLETSQLAATSETVMDHHSIKLLIGYCFLIAFASVAGGWLPSLITLTHNRLQLMMSLVGGLMLGIGIFHMLPHAMQELNDASRCVWWLMMGILTMFFLIRAFHFHDHGVAEVPSDEQTSAQPDEHHHPHAASHGHELCNHSHRISWAGIAVGLSIHTLIDGIALAASVQSDAGHGAILSLFGLGTFLAIVLHKPLDAVSITALMTAGGWSPRSRNFVNAAFAMMCPVGAALFYFGLRQFAGLSNELAGCVLAFSAGVFLCIALSDLLPEMEFHSHNRIPLTIALLAGIFIAWLIGFLEPEQAHNHNPSQKTSSVQRSVNDRS